MIICKIRDPTQRDEILWPDSVCNYATWPAQATGWFILTHSSQTFSVPGCYGRWSTDNKKENKCNIARPTPGTHIELSLGLKFSHFFFGNSSYN